MRSLSTLNGSLTNTMSRPSVKNIYYPNFEIICRPANGTLQAVPANGQPKLAKELIFANVQIKNILKK